MAFIHLICVLVFCDTNPPNIIVYLFTPPIFIAWRCLEFGGGSEASIIPLSVFFVLLQWFLPFVLFYWWLSRKKRNMLQGLDDKKHNSSGE